MTFDARDFKVSGQWAKEADVVIPPTPLTGRTYRKVDLTREDAEKGQPYDEIWESSRNNQKDFEISGVALQASKLGITVWSPLEDYMPGSIQLGTDGVPYRCMIAHGSQTQDPMTAGLMIGPKDPANLENTGEDLWWVTLSHYLLMDGLGEIPKMSYLPERDTGALRNGAGYTQVNDPILDLDAANRRWVLNEITKGSTNVVKPVITSPADNYTFQTLGVAVTVSEIELTGGGTPTPSGTHMRVLGANGVDIVADAVFGYTTTPSVAVDEIVLGDSLFVMVRHRDSVEGWSTWSEKKPLKMAAVIQQAASMVSPGRYAQNIGFYNLTLTFSAGKWSDGSAYSGSQTSLVIYNVATGAVAYNSGWISYRTSLALPAGTLKPGTTYWAAVQHKAVSAPVKNPNAILEGPKVTDANNANATIFTTIVAQAPNISGLQHSFPGGMNHGVQANGAIWGATSSEGTNVTYDIRGISYGLSFSKTTGIVDSENIVIGGSAASQVYTASFQIVAKSASGAEATPRVVSVIIVQPISASFTAPGNYTFAAPVSGYYRVIVGSGGGSSDYNSSGGGGGCAIHNALRLNAGTVYNIIVGGAEGTTSFHGMVYATGGIGAQPGIGYGGQTNTTGGNGVIFQGYAGYASGGGGAGYSHGGNGYQAALGQGTPDGGSSGGGHGGGDGESPSNVPGHPAGYGGFAGGGASAGVSKESGVNYKGGHGSCFVDFMNFVA